MASPKGGGQGINALLRYLNYIISKIEKISIFNKKTKNESRNSRQL